MQTVGIFAGRGDVVIAIGLALILGFIIGYKAHALISNIKKRFEK